MHLSNHSNKREAITLLKNRKFILLLIVSFSLMFILAACGASSDEDSDDTGADNGEESKAKGDGDDTDFKAALVTDVGGVDDKSFNQSAWEGLQSWGEEHGLEQGNGYDYAQSDADADRSEEHTSELQSRFDLVCRLLLEKK